MRKAEVKNLSNEDLVQSIKDSRDELFRLRFQLKSGQLQNYMRISQVKRDIARFLTAIKERSKQ